MDSTTAPRRLRADAARNRQALIDAAARMFAARGWAVTLDDIAVEAGVNVATAYRHFDNKHELADACLEQKISQVIAIAQDAAAAPDPGRGLDMFLERMLELMTANRDLHDVFTPGYATEWLDRLAARVEAVVEDLLARARAQGLVRPDLGVGDLGVLLQMLATVADLPGANHALRLRYLGIVLAGLRPSATPLAGSPPPASDVRSARSRKGPRP